VLLELALLLQQRSQRHRHGPMAETIQDCTRVLYSGRLSIFPALHAQILTVTFLYKNSFKQHGINLHSNPALPKKTSNKETPSKSQSGTFTTSLTGLNALLHTLILVTYSHTRHNYNAPAKLELELKPFSSALTTYMRYNPKNSQNFGAATPLGA